jgi:hypothetical protein
MAHNVGVNTRSACAKMPDRPCLARDYFCRLTTLRGRNLTVETVMQSTKGLHTVTTLRLACCALAQRSVLAMRGSKFHDLPVGPLHGRRQDPSLRDSAPVALIHKSSIETSDFIRTTTRLAKLSGPIAISVLYRSTKPV